MNVTNDENEMRIASALWFYYLSKLIEFIDTILMVVRKRFNQLTFLHVFHHSSMFFLWWIVLTWLPVRLSALLCSPLVTGTSLRSISRVDKPG